MTETYLLTSSITTMASSPALSLYIPRVFHELKDKDIIQIFTRLNIGIVKRVDVIIPGMKHDPHQELEEDITQPPEPLPLFNIVFVHFSSWNMDNDVAKQFYTQVFENDEEVRIRYDDNGHFLKVYRNKNPKSDEHYELEQAFKKQQDIIKRMKEKMSFFEDMLDVDVVEALNQCYEKQPETVQEYLKLYKENKAKEHEDEEEEECQGCLQEYLNCHEDCQGCPEEYR